MSLYDISMTIHPDMQVYKNKPEKRPQFEITSDFVVGQSHETKIHLDVHTGTHIDAPLHMLPAGTTVDQLSLGNLIRPCKVIDLTHIQEAIHAQDLQSLEIDPDDFLLLKTQNSWDEQFNSHFIYVAKDAAQWLVQHHIAGVGVDGLGIEREQAGHPTHKILFQQNILIIEGLRLSSISPGIYLMIAAPIKLHGLDAAPARVILMDFPIECANVKYV